MTSVIYPECNILPTHHKCCVCKTNHVCPECSFKRGHNDDLNKTMCQVYYHDSLANEAIAKSRKRANEVEKRRQEFARNEDSGLAAYQMRKEQRAIRTKSRRKEKENILKLKRKRRS